MGPSADWDTLGSTDAFYRRIQLYSLAWSFPGGDLADYILVGARNGGPVALTRDESKPVLIKDTNSAGSGKKKRVWVYSCSGILLHSITWDHTSRIVKMGFTQSESLVILAKDGVYRIYAIAPAGDPSLPAAYSQHSLVHDVGDSTVLDARIYEVGMVVLLSSHQFLELKGWPERNLLQPSTSYASTSISPAAGQTPRESASFGHGRGRVERFVDSDLDKTPSAWCLLTPEQSTSRQAEVLYSSGEGLFSIDQLDLQDQRFSRGPFSHIVPSPSGRFMALLTQNKPQKLYVVSSNYAETLSEYDLSAETETEPPKTVLWCGNNSVVLAWDAKIVMVGPYGQTLRYYYLDPIHLVTEVDGLRIISLDKCEFLQKVPASTVAVFSPGSVHASAILYEAYEEFTARNAHSHESIQNIKAELVEAVDTCVDAAGREIDVAWQRRLLKAASFGKAFLDLYNPSDYVSMSQTLRVLNAIRYYEIGIPITYDQYLTHSPSALVSRLILRNQHLLALRISAFLKLSAAPVLRHWAQVKVTGSKNDQGDSSRVCELIVKRLREETSKNSVGASDVSCADVARTAWEEGKTALATKLLEHEPRASKQVHLLLKMKEDNSALSKASRSGDSDLVLSVLLSLRRHHAVGTFFRFLDGKDEAIAILTGYGKKHDKELVRDFWYQDDRRTESACFDLEQAAAIGFPAGRSDSQTTSEALSPEQFGQKMEKIRSAQKSFGEDKERGFEAKICEEQTRLLAFQQGLQTEAEAGVNVPFVGLSLNETIKQCIIHNWPKKAEKLRSEWKVSDRRWYYIKLKALVETRNWDQLEQFAKSKKPVIGFEPFAEHLIATGNPRQAMNYIPRCEGRNRPELYVKAGDWAKAGEECRDRGERGKLNELIQRAPNNIISAQLTSMLEDTRSF